MASHAEEIRRQLAESARVKQSFPDELVERISQLAEKSAAALRAGGKIVFFAAPRTRCILRRNWSSDCARNARAWQHLRSPRIPPSLPRQATTTDSNVFFRGRSNRWWRRMTFSLRLLQVETAQTFCAASKQAARAGLIL